MDKIYILYNPFWILIFVVLFILFPNMHLVILMLTWLWIMIYCLKELQNRVLLMSFMVTIYTFLLTRLTIPYIYENAYVVDSWERTIEFSKATYDKMYIAIFIAIISFFAGYTINFKHQNRGALFNKDSEKNRCIRKIALKIYYFSYIFFALEILEKVYFVFQNGYMEYYISFYHSMPSIIYKLSTAYELVFYIFLATLPSKYEAKRPIILYIIVKLISLLTGARNEFILALLFIIIYVYIRNALIPNDPWITKRWGRILVLFIPSICALMFLVLLLRGDSEIEGFNIFDMALNLMFQQGSSMQVLGLTFENATELDTSRMFSFGPLIDKYNDNIIFRLLGIGKHYNSNTIEMATYGHNFGDYMTYKFQPDRYLAGGGLASSYIAEVWLDFGWIGIAIWSFVYGTILAKLYDWARRNIWISAISFFVVMQIIYSPRACAIYFISEIISPTYLLVIFIIWHFSKDKNAK